jgi:hypothetical protein
VSPTLAYTVSRMRFYAQIARRCGASTALLVVLAGTTLMSFACSSEDDSGWLRGKDRGKNDDPNGGGPQGPYDPGSPTNKGPALNPDGFAAVRPILQRSCTECHHAGTWLDLTAAADEETAQKMVAAIQKGAMPPAPRTPLAAEELAKIEAWRAGKVEPVTPIDLDPPKTPVTQIVSASALTNYRAALPEIAYERLDKILKSPSTLFWDKTAMPPAYQDTVGNGADLPFGARLNSEGQSLIVPEGKKLFSDDGATWSFPFGHTAGTDLSGNAVVVDFMSLPVENGSPLPIAYRVETETKSGFPINRWNWSYPKGTVVGEIIFVKDGANFVTTEIRTRERFADRWATNSFRPFPTAKSLAAAIKQRRANWQATPGLKSAVEALENDATLEAKKVDSPAFSNLVTLEGAVDAPLPDLGDAALVRELLTKTKFVSAYGTTWKTNGTLKAFGPTGGAAPLGLIPDRAELGLLEVRETTCEKCHNQGGWFIGDLVDAAVLYGDIWGVDRIFSFHPFEPSAIDASGNENRSVRAAFSGLFEQYDANKHPATRYTFYRPKP